MNKKQIIERNYLRKNRVLFNYTKVCNYVVENEIDTLHLIIQDNSKLRGHISNYFEATGIFVRIGSDSNDFIRGLSTVCCEIHLRVLPIKPKRKLRTRNQVK